MYISYSAETFDNLGYGIISFRSWERECALAVTEQIRTTFHLPNNIDEDDNEVYFEVDDRHLFYGEIKPYFYKVVIAFYDMKREEKRLAALAAAKAKRVPRYCYGSALGWYRKGPDGYRARRDTLCGQISGC